MRTQRYRECAWCGFSFLIKRDTARYCTPAHRTAAYEARKREQANAAVVEPGPAVAAVPPPPPDGEAEPLPQDGDSDAGGLDRAVPAAPGALTVAVHAELGERQRLDTPLGRALLVLAERLDHCQGESGSSVARLVQELRATRNAALDIAAATGSGGGEGPVDPLEARRLERERRREQATS